MKKKKGFFGEFGGSYVSYEMQQELNKIEVQYNILKKNKTFKNELEYLRKYFQGRPTPLYYCEKLTKLVGGAKMYLKREDLNHTGAHKINHCIGEALLAKHLGKEKIIAETQKEPSVEEIAEIMGVKKETVVLALEAIVEPISIYEPVYYDAGDTIYVMDQIGDSHSDVDWIDEILLKKAINDLHLWAA